MSPDTIAVGVFSIAGTLLGVLVGLFGERYLRRMGKVRCRLAYERVALDAKLKPEFQRSTLEKDKHILVGYREQLAQMYDERASYHFRIEFFIDKDVDTGLSNIHGVMIGPDGRDFAELKPAGGELSLELPPRKWVPYSLNSTENFGGDRREAARLCKEIQVRGTFPGGTKYQSPRLSIKNEYRFPGDEVRKQRES